MSAGAETGAALTFIAPPSPPLSLLLGATIEGPAGAAAARVAGVALLALGFAGWLARMAGLSRAGRAVIKAMTVDNVAVIGVLAHARAGLETTGSLFWPVVAGHAALAPRCLACLRSSDTSIPAAAGR